MNNQKHLPDLSHFPEHLLFIGTAKYSGKSDYTSFMASHGGETNTYTSPEITNYYFNVGADRLGITLDRFSQLFVAPLFP